MKNHYLISKIIIVIFSALLPLIVLHHESISMKIFYTALVSFGALITSFLTSPVSRKIVSMGDRIENRYLRIAYYVSILPLVILLIFVACMVVPFVYSLFVTSGDFIRAIGKAVAMLATCIVASIVCIIPYLQAILVLVLRRFVRQ